MVTFNTDLKKEVDNVIHRGAIELLTKYMLDGTLQSKTNTFEGTEQEEALKKEYLDDLFAFIDKSSLEDKLKTIIKETITDVVYKGKANIQSILNISKHESYYLLSVLNERCDTILRKTGLWTLEISKDDRNYLEAFICTLKLRYEEPNKYADYDKKWNEIIEALNGIAKECQTFGAPHVYDKLNNLIKIQTIHENFR